ncbi:hypothetical protein [Klebsiella quasipneumoniae]|uniref:hypothetical protein n=1 Tax=Klebsiella quasipneumoniae TaxID=1463165 RepID=UPI002168AAE8|nr:hypothetical protein [Klebsiella quasipneumoniae]MCS4388885.1 hypothetical protein [Klebsiella quasipneumoniae subsp. similipneumoniae]MCS4410759.1 hypothetical protein [Klebsiella quasipneumoniae subsp. similipneumoniae]
MLDGYFGIPDPGVSTENHQRLLAVKAALEVVKASAASAAGDSSNGKMYQDLDFATSKIAELADAIQDALDTDSE